MPHELAMRLEQAISGDDALRLPGLNFTPAQLEQMCAEFEEIEELVSHVEGLSMPKAAGFTHQASSVLNVA